MFAWLNMKFRRGGESEDIKTQHGHTQESLLRGIKGILMVASVKNLKKSF